MFATSAFEEERCQTILKNKGFCVNYGDVCFLDLYYDKSRKYMYMTLPRRIWHIHVFHIGYLAAQNEVVVWTAETDNIFIIILIDMEKLEASINAWP